MLLMVGGGVCMMDDICKFFLVGVDKVFVNMVVVKDCEFVCEVFCKFGE